MFISKAHTPVANKRINSMIARAETPQLHLLPVFDLFSITVAPFNRDIGIGVGVHKHIESAVTVELWEESH